jgi:hypothetical protein
MASAMASEQIPPELQQQMAQLEQAAATGQIPPDQVQAMQQEMTGIIEQVSSPILAQLTQELLLSIGQGSPEDPLVAIREQELALRQAEMEQDQEQFQIRETARANEKLLEAELAKQRIDATERVNSEKMDLAIQRLAQQADLKLTELAAKYGPLQ